MSASASHIQLYWATGCTSCLRAKEFLERNEVDFESLNVVENESILDDMEAVGLPRQVPIIKRGDEWADAQMLSEVARIAEVDHAADPLPVDELFQRLTTILETLESYVDLYPASELDTNIPNRPRSIGELTFHAFSLPESFLEHEDGVPLRSYKPELPWTNQSTDVLKAYGQYVQIRLRDWYDGPGSDRDWSETANVYYGDPTVHGFFERTTWHTGQHTRQLEWVLEEQLGIDIEPLPEETWDGLPLPEKVWDAQ